MIKIMRALRKRAPLFVLAAMTLLFLSTESYAASTHGEKMKALNSIANFAIQMCRDIPLQSQSGNLELTGVAKIELKDLVNKMIKLGIDDAAKYKKVEHEILLQKNIVQALNDNTKCWLIMWTDLKENFLEQK